MSFVNSIRSALRPRVALLGQPLSASFAPRPRNFTSTARVFFAQLPEQPRLRLGSTAPNFKAQTTHGDIDFHEFIGDKWAILFSHPADFTPVCTTELGAFAKLQPEFTQRNVKLIGLSANGIDMHKEWEKDIDEVTGAKMSTGGGFPIIADESRRISYLYDMVEESQIGNLATAFTIRSVYIIDPAKKIRLIMTYPASTGRNTAEVLRVIDSLQTADKNGIATAVNWTVGDDVIVPPTVSTEDAKKKFGADNVRELKPYLRFTTLKK